MVSFRLFGSLLTLLHIDICSAMRVSPTTGEVRALAGQGVQAAARTSHPHAALDVGPLSNFSAHMPGSSLVSLTANDPGNDFGKTPDHGLGTWPLMAIMGLLSMTLAIVANESFEHRAEALLSRVQTLLLDVTVLKDRIAELEGKAALLRKTLEKHLDEAKIGTARASKLLGEVRIFCCMVVVLFCIFALLWIVWVDYDSLVKDLLVEGKKLSSDINWKPMLHLVAVSLTTAIMIVAFWTYFKSQEGRLQKEVHIAQRRLEDADLPIAQLRIQLDERKGLCHTTKEKLVKMKDWRSSWKRAGMCAALLFPFLCSARVWWHGDRYSLGVDAHFNIDMWLPVPMLCCAGLAFALVFIYMKRRLPIASDKQIEEVVDRVNNSVDKEQPLLKGVPEVAGAAAAVPAAGKKP